ncbi:MAG: replication-associated recombination protein A [Candidatus Gottesmanbacteria bacterium]|nr:replication-associated recombination protein A [Candidatus Gottesmanbacteria bacterium]
MTDYRPLAEILRPKTLDEVVGQDHLVGASGIIRKMLGSTFLPSMIFWGPPGSGKTSLAFLLATLSNAHFVAKSAVTSSLAEVRTIVKEAQALLDSSGQRTVFFLDEIHRFNKAQQDALLPHVEHGTVIFIGATTENPSFEVISPLLSRCRVLVLKPLEDKDLNAIIDRGLSYLKRKLDDDARTFLKEVANGDGRALLTILEISARLTDSKITRNKSGTIPARLPARQGIKRSNSISASDIEEAAQKKMLQYDQTGEEHYNTISAFIKSMRASDIDAALYYLARMVAAGEDPLFIARRMVIFASEDIGLAQPTALVVANAVFDGCHKVGYPEAQILLAHGVSYLAQAKKDRSAYDAFFAALSDVKQFGNLPIPLMIRNAPTKLMKDLNYGKGYQKYTTESLLPEKLKGKKYYNRTGSSA